MFMWGKESLWKKATTDNQTYREGPTSSQLLQLVTLTSWSERLVVAAQCQTVSGLWVPLSSNLLFSQTFVSSHDRSSSLIKCLLCTLRIFYHYAYFLPLLLKVPQSHLDLENVRSILSEYRIHNADVTLRCDATADDLIDVVEGNRWVWLVGVVTMLIALALLSVGSTYRVYTYLTKSIKYLSRWVALFVPFVGINS